MKLKNILIVVKDIERSKQFYHDMFGLEKVLDSGGNCKNCTRVIKF
ncbi:Glyoxalase/Bleomycin resistance protein/Dioxygenase superfamily protein [Hathewaya proteolytica DSM 3090]|uniref:Glyoxalase/Bleomycin resistance protein/Dioxygenase superfamily protein n=1 Tax=Hathewaya proteolytica DSM 3090 TaxID=1121331 RepID=A0A1M6M0L5_9CLOT|nr:Glyoxalase/Bleomycin resistance protein/Dioxygenase superfamily protein [Hathewaya proteolytica DSM 3090]